MYKVNLKHFDSSKTKAQLEEELKVMKAQLDAAAGGDTAAIAAKILEDAQAKADKILADAAAKSSETVVEPGSDMSIEEYLEERVPVMLYKDNERYKDDVVLAINGEKIQIQRGKQVKIPRKFAMVLESQYRQQMIATELQDQLIDEFKGREKILT